MRKPRPGTLLLILWGLLLTGGVVLYLQYLQPARLGKTVSSALEAVLGVPSVIHHVDLDFFPHPTINIQGLQVDYQGEGRAYFQANSCSAQLSWTSLFRLKPVVRSIELYKPTFDGILPPPDPDATTDEDPAALLSHFILPQALPALPAPLTGIHLKLVDGNLRLQQEKTDLYLLLNGIQGVARLPGLLSGTLDLDVASTRLYKDNLPAIGLGEFHLKATSRNDRRGEEIQGTLHVSTLAQMGSLEEALGITLPEEYRYFPLPEPAWLELSLNMGTNTAERSIHLEGEAKARLVLPMNNHPTSLYVSLPFSMQGLDSISVYGMELMLGDDVARIHGNVAGLDQYAPVFTGQAEVEHFSLVRWFGFGRSLTAGLQQALNDMTGKLEFTLSPKGVEVSRLEGNVMGMAFTGSGGCADFRKPVVAIRAHAPYVDLDRVFPEVTGIPVERPQLPPPAVPTGEATPGPAVVGFDIVLTADTADIARLSPQGIECRITPIIGPDEKGRDDELNSAQLHININNLHGGTATSHALLLAPFKVQTSLAGVQMEEVTRRLTGFQALGGTLAAENTLLFDEGTPAQMIGSMRGTVNAHITDGYFGARSGERMAFTALDIHSESAARPDPAWHSPDIPPVMDFSGDWNVRLNTSYYEIKGYSNALMTYNLRNGLPLRMPPQIAAFQVRLDKDGLGRGQWPAHLDFSLEGQVGFDIDAQTVTLRDMDGGRAGLVMGASLQARNIFDDLVLEGPIILKTAILRDMAPLVGLHIPKTETASFGEHCIVEANLRVTEQALEFRTIHTQLDESIITGDLNLRFGSRPLWTGQLLVNALNLDKYWPVADEEAGNPVPVTLLQNVDMDLQLRATSLTWFSSTLNQVYMPFRLYGGKLHSDVAAILPGGGTLAGLYQGEALLSQGQPELSNRFQFRMENVNMLPLTRSRAQDTLIAGKGSFTADLQARLRRWGDMPAALNGNWYALILDGYLIDAQDAPLPPSTGSGDNDWRGQPQAPQDNGKTPFQHITASGNVLGGIVSSEDFILRGNGLAVRGGGTIDLNTRSIDAKATATLFGVPEMPMSITGSLDDPKTSYHVAGAVTGTIGNIGGTLLDTVGSIITAPFRLFSRSNRP